MSEQHGVYVEFGGQKTRVGTAHRGEDGTFVLVLGGTLSLGPSEGPARASGASSGGGGGAVFPNYGRSKGKPIYGAPLQELEYYANNARKSIDDPAKARWRTKEEALLAALETEIHRQNGGEGYTPPQTRGSDIAPDDSDDLPF